MNEETAKSNQRNFRRMVVSAKASYGALSLIVAICDNSQYRDELIEAYESELSAAEAECFRVTIDRDRPSLRDCLLELVEREGELVGDRRCIVTVLGGDELLGVRLKDEKSVQEKFGYSLQWTREALRRFKAPIVIWLNSSMADLLSNQAKDFWSWRTGPFRIPVSEFWNIEGITLLEIGDRVCWIVELRTGKLPHIPLDGAIDI